MHLTISTTHRPATDRYLLHKHPQRAQMQGFFTREAVRNIGETTLANITDFERGRINPAHQVKAEVHIKDAAATVGVESVR